MDNRMRENSIEVLKKVLDVYQGQLDTRVVVEIEVVIAALEDLQNSQSDTSSWEARGQMLKVIADVVAIVTNISSLMR